MSSLKRVLTLFPFPTSVSVVRVLKSHYADKTRHDLPPVHRDTKEFGMVYDVMFWRKNKKRFIFIIIFLGGPSVS